MPFADPDIEREYTRKKKMAYYWRWKAEGRCTNCGNAQLAAGSPLCEGCLANRRRFSAEYAVRLRDEAYRAYGGARCVCCGECEPTFLCIDHVEGGGNEHRRQIASEGGSANFYAWLKREGYPPGFQVLCQNCNVGKWRNGGVCPHQQRQLEAV